LYLTVGLENRTRIWCHWAALLAILGGMTFAGCRPNEPTSIRIDTPSSNEESAPKAPPPPAPPLVVAIVDDPELGKVCAREWQAEQGSPVELRLLSSAELHADVVQACDVVIAPSASLGTIVAWGLVEPLPAQWLTNPEWNADDLLLRDRTEFVTWGKDVVAMSFGSPTFCFLYQPDIWKNAKLKPPQTWKEYAEQIPLLQRMSGSSDGAGPVAVEPLAPGWAAPVFLARAAPYVRHVSQSSTLFSTSDFSPRIEGAPFERALQELVRCAHQTGQPQRWLVTTPADAARGILQAEFAIAMTWPHAAWFPAGTNVPTSGPTLSILPLPGSKQYYSSRSSAWEQREDGLTAHVPFFGSSGRLGLVTNTSKHKQAAFSLLAWLTAQQRKSTIPVVSSWCFVARKSHLNDAARWLGPFARDDVTERFTKMVEQEHLEELWLTYPRFAHAARYMSVLDDAVRAAVETQEDPKKTLQDVSAAWERLTDELGREALRRSNLESLGLGDFAK